MNRFILSFICISLPVIVCGQTFLLGDYGENFSWNIESEGCTTEKIFEPVGGHNEDGDYYWSDYEERPSMGISVKPNGNNKFNKAYLEWEDTDGNINRDELQIITQGSIAGKSRDDNSGTWVGSFDINGTDWIGNDKSVLNFKFEYDEVYNSLVDKMPCIVLHANCKNTIKIYYEEAQDDNFSWSVNCEGGSEQVYGPDSNWLYDETDLDENGEFLVGPFLGMYVTPNKNYAFSEAFLEWEDEQGNVNKDILYNSSEGCIWEDGVSPKNSIGEESVIWIGNKEGTIQVDESLFKIPCIALHKNCKNTVNVIFKQLTTINFNLIKEYNKHPLYDDCLFLKEPLYATLSYHYNNGEYDWGQSSKEIEIPSSFSEMIEYGNSNEIISGNLDDVPVSYLTVENMMNNKSICFSTNEIFNSGEYIIDITPSLSNSGEEANLFWGLNFQFDINGYGEVKYYFKGNEETVSGKGLVGKHHWVCEEDFYDNKILLSFYPYSGKLLESVKLIYENGIDDELKEVVLNTVYDEELQGYKLFEGDGYMIFDDYLSLESGWMNTIVVRFKDAEPLELADDDSEKPAGEKNSALITAKDGVLTDVVLSGRTLYKDNSWNTLCLPFSLTEDEIASGPLSGADIRTLNSGSVTKNNELQYADINLWHVSMKFKYVTAIEAGKPYIIKWLSGDAITDPKFENVTVEDTQNPVTVADGHVVFTGYYDAFTATPNDTPMIYYLTDNNELKYTASDRVLKACRAYFTFTPGDGSGSADGFTFDIDFGNGEETDIVTVLSPKGEANGHWYTLDGRRLNGKPTMKGVYINNGQKVVVK